MKSNKIKEVFGLCFQTGIFSFKQYLTYFYILFHPYVFLQMFSNNNF